MALDKGYYKAEGLDVTMDPGQGSAGAVQRVATGAYQIGFADVNSTIEYNAKNPGKEVLCVFMAYDFAPFGVYALKKSGIKVPKDLEGKKLGAPVFDASFRLFPAFAKMNGITKWEHVNLTPQLREQSLVQGTVDFISGHYFSSMLDLKARGVKFDDIVAMRYVDFGIDVYGNGIVVSPEMAKNEKAVKGFIAATLKGWKDVIADNKLGIAAAKKKDPLIDEALETERLQISLQTNILTPYVKANGMGDVDPARFARSVKLVSEAFGLPPRRRRTRSSPTSSCRPRPTGWSRSESVRRLRASARRSVDQPHLPARQGNDARPGRCHHRHRQGRVRRRGRPVGLRQVDDHEAGHRAAAGDTGEVHGRGREGDAADQGRRHGVPEPDPDAVAHARSTTCCCRWRSSSRTSAASAAIAPSTSRRRWRCWRPSASPTSPTSFPGSSRAACSSAPTSAAR